MAKSKPIHQIRIGRVKAAIWANTTKAGATRYAVTVDRLYRDAKGWQSSPSFSRDDLPLVAKVLDRVHTWLFEQPRSARA